ncbi:hypothetical protein [Polaromonas jejuensis]|uniref:Integrase n=2 Tax=Polaromonas jejuensis TaxID=457502 RepID=A0ABW0Q5M4_9BURK
MPQTNNPDLFATSPAHGMSERPNPYDSWSERLIAGELLSQVSAYKYRTLWNAWCDWLRLRALDWYAVDGPLIEEFLQGAAPGQGVGRRKAINAERMSSYTRQRYWRLLRGVYAAAAREGTVPYNPVLDIAEEARPSISNGDRRSQVLDPHVFAKLRDPRIMEALIPAKTAADWWHPRDRAILAVLVDTGITASELLALRGIHVVRAEQQFSMAHEVPASLAIKVMESSDGVERTLIISPTATPALVEWLHLRHLLLVEHAAHKGAMVQRNEFIKEIDSQGPLFVARRARAKASELPPMGAPALYYCVSQALKKLRQKTTVGSGTLDINIPHLAKGPAIIRNTVIHHWLNTLGPEETVIRAGLKKVESLRFPS